jgi:hypothetical protein
MENAETDHFIGKSLEAMKCYAAEHDFNIRIMAEEGEHFLGTCELRSNRININLVDGIVTEAWMG